MDTTYTINVIIGEMEIIIDRIDNHSDALKTMDDLQIDIARSLTSDNNPLLRYVNSESNVFLLRAERIEVIYMTEENDDDDDGENKAVPAPDNTEPVSV